MSGVFVGKCPACGYSPGAQGRPPGAVKVWAYLWVNREILGRPEGRDWVAKQISQELQRAVEDAS